MTTSHAIACRIVKQRAQESAQACDVFILAGITALVHPAASLPQLAKSNGALLVEINPEETNLSGGRQILLCETSQKKSCLN